MINNPQKLIDEKIITPCEFTQVQQNGVDLTVSEDVFLDRGESKNILLNERIKIPIDMCGELKIRSTYSRQGVFLSSGFWDSGFEGTLGCTLYNMGNKEILIPKNERVCQFISFHAKAASSYNGRWQNK